MAPDFRQGIRSGRGAGSPERPDEHKPFGYFLITYDRGEIDAAALQYFFLQGEDFVNVVYTCLVKDLRRLRPEFEKSLATLKADDVADSAKAAAAKP